MSMDSCSAPSIAGAAYDSISSASPNPTFPHPSYRATLRSSFTGASPKIPKRTQRTDSAAKGDNHGYAGRRRKTEPATHLPHAECVSEHGRTACRDRSRHIYGHRRKGGHDCETGGALPRHRAWTSHSLRLSCDHRLSYQAGPALRADAGIGGLSRPPLAHLDGLDSWVSHAPGSCHGLYV